MTLTATVFDSNRTADVASPNGVALYEAQRNAAGQLTDFRLHQLNTAALLAWQRPEADLIGRLVSQLFPETDADFLIQQFGLVLNSGRAVQFSMQYGGPETGVAARDYEVRVEKHDDCVRVSYGDVPVREQAGQVHAKETDLLQAVLDNARIAISAFDTVRDETGQVIDFRYTMVNKMAVDQSGLSESDLLGHRLAEVFPTIKQSEVFGHWRAVVETRQPRQFELHYPYDGFDTWTLCSGAPYGDGLVISSTDITTQKLAETQARQQADLLESIQNTTQMGISAYRAIRDETGTITDFMPVFRNAESARLARQTAGVAARESGLLAGDTLLNQVPSVKAMGLFDRHIRVVETGQGEQFEQRYTGDGIEGWFTLSIQPWTDGFVATVLETKELSRAERETSRQGNMLMSVVENGKAGMTLFDLIRDETGAITDFQYVFTNAVNARNTGRSVADMTGNTLLTLLPGVARTEWYGRLMNTATTGQSESFLFGYEAENIRGWFDTSFVKIGDDQVLFTDLNVTALKDAELALQRQNRLLQEVVDNTQVGLLLVEPIRDEARQITDFRYVLTNDYNARMGGRQVADLTGAVVGEVFAGWQDSDLFRRMVAVAESGQPQRLTFPYDAYGYMGWFDGSFAVVNGYVLYTYTDVTPLKDAEVAAQKNADLLAVKNRELKRTNENLRSFAYIASHDLQEPLRKLTSFADILNTQYAGQLDAEAADIVQRMNTAAGRMRLLIQDLLTYSRVEIQPGSYKSVNLTILIEELRENELWAALRQSKAQLRFEGLPTLTADPSQMRQLFQNLLSNAIKFSRPGVVPAITISSRVIARADVPPGLLSSAKAEESSPGGNHFYEIAVSDNGIGFEEKYAEQIFQVFQRLHGRNQYVGSGIGLAICQKISERHEGAITATSEPDRGSTFRVYLPVRE